MKGARSTVEGIFDSFAVVRSYVDDADGGNGDRDRRGRLKTDQEDLLRAAVVFTSAGLDTCCKRLLTEALPVLLRTDTGARASYRAWIAKAFDGKVVPKRIREAVLQWDYDGMMSAYVDQVTQRSLQGHEELKGVRDALGLDLPDDRLDAVRQFFTVRTLIVHDLDYKDVRGQGSARHRRRISEVRDWCDEVFLLAADLIAEAAQAVREAKRSLSPVPLEDVPELGNAAPTVTVVPEPADLDLQLQPAQSETNSVDGPLG